MFSNSAYDRADQLAEQERQSGIDAASKALSGTGSADCIDCECPIQSGRRAAIPSARRCAECQKKHEIEKAQAAR